MARRWRPAQPDGRRPGRKRRPPRQSGPGKPEVPDTPMAKLEEETRRDIASVMAARKADRGLSEPERLLARILDQHPEHAADYEEAHATLVTGAEDSPLLHVALHRIVEQRVVRRELPDEMSRLTRGKPWHEAVHDVAERVAEELFGPQLQPSDG